jgi:V8-like Glu-specific endopeptidase
MKAAKPVEAILRKHPGLASAAGVPTPVQPDSDFKQVADPTAPGFREHGVIFFLVEGIFPGRCSGTAVNSPNRSVVFTAGHCVYENFLGGIWFDENWVFVPGYRFGQRPFGVFPATRIDATRQWIAGGSENFDVGAAVVGRNEKGQLLGTAVGGTGIAWNQKPNQVFDVHGYPAEIPFDGETQRICTQTPYLGHDAESFLEPGPPNLTVGCEVTGGASGGGWTIAGNRLNSVTNYGYSDAPDADFGAYFGPEVARLYGRVAKGK